MQIWDVSEKAKCLARFTAAQFKSKGKVNCARFSPAQVSNTLKSTLQNNLLAVGLSCGTLALVDCARCEVIRQETLDSEGIVSIAFSHQKKDTCYVAGKHSYAVSISPKIKIS